MLFNSYSFIFLFLPVTLIIFYQIGNRGYYQSAILWLVLASLLFYAWWNPVYLLLLTGSIFFNFFLGRKLAQKSYLSERKKILFFGISVNLGTLGYFKYANFFVENANILFSNSYHLDSIILPLAISFFTFQQITFLVDAYRGITHEYSFLHYCLFVVFFPQLIAGPIVHHKEMLPQFSQLSIYRFTHDKLAIGSAFFILGLFKKVVIADSIALYSTPMFDAAQQGISISFFEAWGGALAYTFQLYFDFSGYSDMAVGLAYLFGIRLALNFYSPYKATSIIDFWRRWHITLSRFLRDYLYIPLGGSRKGSFRRYSNLMITMLLGGLWHGAGWTFVIWGLLHGLYLVLNQLWRTFYINVKGNKNGSTWWGTMSARALTFLAVVVAWVFFRAENFNTAIEIHKGMLGMNGVILPPSYFDYLNHIFSLGNFLHSLGWRFEDNVPYFKGFSQIISIFFLLIVVWFLPNVHQILWKYSPIMDSTSITEKTTNDTIIKWRPGPAIAAIFSLLMLIIIFKMDSTSEFLYFQF